MNELCEYLKSKRKVKTTLVKSHKRTLKNGKIISVDPYMAIKKINYLNKAKKASKNNKMHGVETKIGDIMRVLGDPHVHKKLKNLIVSHIKVHESPKVKHAMIKFKDGDMIMMVNPKYVRKSIS